MTAQATNLIVKKRNLQARKKRLFNLNDSILSNKTVFLNNYEEESNHLSTEEVAMFAAVNKWFEE